MTITDADPRTGAVDRLADLVDATGGDRRAKRRLLDRASRILAADAEAERCARSAIAQAEQRAKAVEADADARIKAAEARLRIQERERAAGRAERDAERAAQVAIRQDRAERAAERRIEVARFREMGGAAAPATLSMLVYCAAVASAVFGQVSVATGRYHWPVWRALMLAAFIELMALAMAMTANRLRLRGERAFAPRVLTWVFASFAAAVNVWGHFTDPLMAAGLGAASLGGITLWEIRSSARHRDALRGAGQLAEAIPRMGWRMWALYLRTAWAAYRLAVRTAVSDTAAPLIAEAEARRALRTSVRVEQGATHLELRTETLLPAVGDTHDSEGDSDPWRYATPLAAVPALADTTTHTSIAAARRRRVRSTRGTQRDGVTARVKTPRTNATSTARRTTRGGNSGTHTTAALVGAVHREHPEWTATEVATHLGKSVRTVERHLTAVRRTGQVDIQSAISA